MARQNNTATATAATETLEVKAPLTCAQILELAATNRMPEFMAEYSAASPEVQAEVTAALQKLNTPVSPKKDLEAEVKRVAALAGVTGHRCLPLVRSITIMEKSASKILAINCDRYEGSKSTRNDRHPFPFTPANVAKNVKGNEADVMDQIEKFKPMALKAALAGLEILNPVAEASAEA